MKVLRILYAEKFLNCFKLLYSLWSTSSFLQEEDLHNMYVHENADSEDNDNDKEEWST